MLINNKKETSPQQSSARNQHTPRLNQERCRPERARSRKGISQLTITKVPFYLWIDVDVLEEILQHVPVIFCLIVSIFLSKLLVVALGVIFRDADVLVHVERLHILEAHFSSLVRLRETCDDGNIIILIAHLDQFLIHPKRSSSCIKK